MKIADNGKGITEDDIFNIDSIGIIGMKERSMVLGGDLIIKGLRGKGTVVTLEIPMNKNIIEENEVIPSLKNVNAL